VLAVCHNYRATASNLAARRLIDEGALGPLLRILWTSNGIRTQAYYDSGAWRGRWETEGGGVMINQTVHDLDLLCWLAGPPAAACPEMWGRRKVMWETITPEPLTLSSHPYMFQDFAGAVREGRDPLVTGEQGRWAIELVNGITLSHVLGRRVGLPLDRDEYDRVLAQLVAHPLPRTELPA